MLMNKLAKRSKIWLYVVPAATLALIVAAWAAMRPINESFAIGILSGGIGGTALVVLLQILGRRRRAGGAARIVAGQGDERDTRIVQEATALAGVITLAALIVVTVVAALVAVPVEIALAIPLWSYLIAATVAYFVIARRS